MYPILRSNLGVQKAIFNKSTDVRINRSMDGTWVLAMGALMDNKTNLIVKGDRIESDGQLFNITSNKFRMASSGDRSVTVKAEHISYEGNKTEYLFDRYAFFGTALAMVTNLISLTGADFTIGTIETTSPDTISINEITTFRRGIDLIASLFGLEVDYDNKVINLVSTIGDNNGTRLSIGSNLKGIDWEEDYLTDEVSIKVDVVAIRNTEEYKAGLIPFVSEAQFGDTVVVVASEDRMVTTRVLEVTKDPVRGTIENYTLSTLTLSYTSNATQVKFETLYKDRAVYGVNLSNTYGLRIDRNDLLARAEFNAEELRFQVGDGFGNYTDAVYFDPIAGEYKFVGNIDATGTITGADIISGTITGALYQTSATGRRIEMSSADQEYINFVDVLDNVYASIAGDFNGSTNDSLTLLANDSISMGDLGFVNFMTIGSGAYVNDGITMYALDGVEILTGDLTLQTEPATTATPIIYGSWDFNPEINLRDGVKFASSIGNTNEATLGRDGSGNLDMENSYGDISLESLFNKVAIAGSVGQAEFGSLGSRLYHSFVEKLRTGAGVSNLYDIWFYNDSSSNEEIATRGYIIDGSYGKLFRGSGVATAYLQAFTNKLEVVVNGTPHDIITW